MAKSTLQITFLRVPTDFEFVQFTIRKILDNNSFGYYYLTYYPWNPRIAKYTLPTPSGGTPLTTVASDFFTYMELDFPLMPATMTQNGSSIYFEAINDEYEFVDILFDPGLISYIVNNSTGPVLYLVDDNSLAATDICNNVRLSIQSNIVADIIRVNGIEITNSNVNNPVEFDVPRGIPIWVELEDSVSGEILYYPYKKDNTSSYNYLQFSFLFNSNISLNINNTFNNGATITVNVTQDSVQPFNKNINISSALVFEYSLNDIDWFTSNVFTGQPVGSGILYVRDQYGCKKQVNYEITSFGSRKPFLFISKALALNFYEQVDWDNYTIFKNSDNAFPHQSIIDIKYCIPALFQTQDKTKIQIKTNYETFIPKLRKEDLTETVIPISKKTNNLNRFKKMDSTYYKYKEGYIGIYFMSGNTYDELDVINGDYTLNGNLPEFAIIGQYVEIEGLGIHQIYDVVFDSNINKKAIIIKYIYNSTPTQAKVSSIYDLLNFEVYEFEIDWNLFGEGLYDVLLENTDTQNGTVYHLSENILILNNHPNTLHIRYFNNNNRDIFYKYGIENIIRIPFTHMRPVPDDEADITKGDLRVGLNESSVYEVDEYFLIDLTNEKLRTLIIALSCSNLFINDIGYVKFESVSVDNIDNSNLNDLSIKLIKTNVNYNINRQGQEGDDINSIEFNIPPFITSGNGFIKS